jgi:hypothetical protein
MMPMPCLFGKEMAKAGINHGEWIPKAIQKPITAFWTFVLVMIMILSRKPKFTDYLILIDCRIENHPIVTSSRSIEWLRKDMVFRSISPSRAVCREGFCSIGTACTLQASEIKKFRISWKVRRIPERRTIHSTICETAPGHDPIIALRPTHWYGFPAVE